MQIYLVIKNNYVINRTVGIPPTEEGQEIVEDVKQEIHIGSWYEKDEGVFYFPFTKPDDPNLPEEIQHLWD